MMKIINFILLYSLIFILSGCAGKDGVVIEDTPSMIIPENKTTEIKYIHNDPFYPMKDKIEDLEFKIDQFCFGVETWTFGLLLRMRREKSWL